MSILRRLYFSRRGWILILPIVLCLSLIAFDTRFAYVSLIVAMGIVMMALPLIYYYYGLTQESRWSILEKTVTITDNGLLLDFTSDKMRQHLISWNDIARTTAANDCLIVKLKKNSYTFLAIPFSAFAGKEELRCFVLEIRRNIGQ